MKPTASEPTGPIQLYIGTAYDIVKEIHDNLDFLKEFNADVGSAVDDAEGYRDEAFQFKEDAIASAVAAGLSEGNAAASATSAYNSLVAAQTAESNVITVESNVTGLEVSASQAASNAQASESNASASELKAQQWAENPEDVEVETGAYSSKHHSLKAEDSASSAQTSENNASQSATDANQAKIDAEAAELVVTTKAGEALASQQAASTSESNAATSASDASTSATTASTKASEALESANNANTSEINAATSETNSAASEAKADLWANAPHGVEVETGKYSSNHWAIESQLAAVGGLSYKGEWDASTGSYPTPAEIGDYYKVSVAGTVSSVDYKANDAIIRNPNSGWDHIDNTETVVSVAGKIGAVSLGVLDIVGLQADLDAKLDVSGVAADATKLNNQLPSYYLDWNNTTNTPTTLAGYGITDAASTVGYNKTNWDTAYGWGNHASVGYLTDLSGFTTSNLTEGTSLYYTVARANSAIDARVDKAFVDGLSVNAGTLDSLDSSQFVRSDAATTVAGKITWDSAGVRIKGTSSPHFLELDVTDGSNTNVITLMNAGTSTGEVMYSPSSNTLNFSSFAKVNINADQTVTGILTAGSYRATSFGDFDSAYSGGLYYSNLQPANTPDGQGSNYYGVVSMERDNGAHATQLVLNANDGYLVSRTSFDGGTSWNATIEYIDNAHDQTISGEKTFNSITNFENNITFNANGKWLEFNKDTITRDTVYWNADGVNEWKLFHDSTGDLRFSPFNTGNDFVVESHINVNTSTGTLKIGSNNASYVHFTTDRERYYFDTNINVNGELLIHGTDYKINSAGDGLFRYGHFNNDLGLDYGSNGRYNNGNGTGTNWGATIWGMGDAYRGTAAGSSWSVGNLYGLSWNRSDKANSHSGEGLHIYRAGTLRAAFGESGAYFSSGGHVVGEFSFNNSDMRLKTDWRPSENATERLMQFEVGYYKWDETANTKAGYLERDFESEDLGFNAQSLQAANPLTVKGVKADNGIKYLTPRDRVILAETVQTCKEQQAYIEKLEHRLSKLERCINALT